MRDAFGVESPYIEKNWSGEPGDKRNTKYAMAYGTSPLFAGVPYTIYRQTDMGRKNRAASIKAAKAKRRAKSKVKKSDGQRNAAAGVAIGSAVAAPAAGIYGLANNMASRENTRRANGGRYRDNPFNLKGKRVDVKGAKKGVKSAKNAYRAAQNDTFKPYENGRIDAKQRIADITNSKKQYKNSKRVLNRNVQSKKMLVSVAHKQKIKGRVGLATAGGLAAVSTGSIIAANTIPRGN